MIILIGSLILLFVINILLPFNIELVNPLLDGYFGIFKGFIFTSIPILITISIKNKYLKISFGVISGIIALFFLLLMAISLEDMEEIKSQKYSFAHQPIGEVEKNGKYYRLYRHDRGAISAHTVVLCEESKNYYGFKMTKILFSQYRAYEASIEFEGNDTIKLLLDQNNKMYSSDVAYIKLE